MYLARKEILRRIREVRCGGESCMTCIAYLEGIATKAKVRVDKGSSPIAWTDNDIERVCKYVLLRQIGFLK